MRRSILFRRRMVKFTLFGVPVTIHPWFWVSSAMLGGAYNAKSPEDFLQIGIFVLIATISILVHEFGHALVGRRLGGGYATIELVALMGLAYNHGGRFTRWQNFWRIAAGPGFGFIFGGIVLVALGFAFGDHDAIALFKMHVIGHRSSLSYPTLDFLLNKPYVSMMIGNLLYINFWWGVLNLLPVLPLDGGRIMDLFVRPQKRVYLISIVVASLCILYGLKTGNYYIAFLFGYFAFNNHKAMKENSWS